MKLDGILPAPKGQHTEGKKVLAEKTANANKDFNGQLKSAAEDLEAFFIEQMLKEMRKNPYGEGGLFPKTFESEFYRDLQDGAIAKDMAKAGGMGLGKFIYEQLKRGNDGPQEKMANFDKRI